MDTICWCNSCYSRRFPYGENDRRKFDDCPTQNVLDYAFEENEKLRVELEEQRMWNEHKGQDNG